MKTIGKCLLLSVALFLLLSSCAWAQHEHHTQPASSAKLALTTDSDRHEIVARLGPLNLPAHTDHMAMPQAAAQFVVMPFDGWITAYHPSLVDNAGNRLPGR